MMGNTSFLIGRSEVRFLFPVPFILLNWKLPGIKCPMVFVSPSRKLIPYHFS